MSNPPIEIRSINSATDDIDGALVALREMLSPRGDVVSEAGKQKTLEVFGEAMTPQQVVARVCDEIETQGLSALLDYTARIDGVSLDRTTIRVDPSDMKRAHDDADPDFLKTVRQVRENILHFSQGILHQETTVKREPGLSMTQRYVPMRRVGVCVPGGAAAYPSSVLMCVVPAQAAGVEEIAVVAPPTPFGANNPDVMAVCHELGVNELYRIGGAQAVAAMAYGVEGLPAVDKIVGPGNLFVALAKQRVYGTVDIDSIAGPSEVVVIADETAIPSHVAAELLAQAEHSPGASVLVTWVPELMEQVQSELNKQTPRLSRSDLTRKSLEQFGCLILVSDANQACQVTDRLAPEHLQITTKDARQMAYRIRNAGATFVGAYSPVAMGDYVAGPSHVLPTSGTARWAGGLCANDFLRSGSVIEYSQAAFAADAPHVQLLAEREQLTAHRASVEIRLK